MIFISVFFAFFTVAFICHRLNIWLYWWRRGVDGPLGWPFLGQVRELASHQLPAFYTLRQLTRHYGNVYGITEGARVTLVISDPDMVRQVFGAQQFEHFHGRKLNPIQGNPDTDRFVHLFFAQGHRWKRLRAISSKAFSNNSLKKLRSTVESSVFEILRFIEINNYENQPLEILNFYQEFTLDVIGRIALGQNDSKIFENPLLEKVKAIFGEDQSALFIFSSTFPMLAGVLRKLLIDYELLGQMPIEQLIETTRKTVEQRIKQRDNDKLRGIEKEANGDDVGEDFIDLFLDAQADVDIEAEKNENFTKGAVKIDRHLTVDEIVGQCFVFLLAGFDTTALSLSYSTFLLSTHPNIQQKLQKEIDFNCPHPSISFEQLSKLKYLDCVIKETLRLYPLAAIANSRKCMKKTKIGEYEIEEGVNILVDTWSLHTNPTIWGDDANEFKPERWEENDSMTKYANCYLPFGLGPRQCIGMRLAYMEEKLLLSHILRKYSFQTGNKTEIPLKLIGRATTQPESLFVHLKPRF